MTTWMKSPGLRLLKLFTPRPVNRGNSDDTLFVVPEINSSLSQVVP